MQAFPVMHGLLPSRWSTCLFRCASGKAEGARGPSHGQRKIRRFPVASPTGKAKANAPATPLAIGPASSIDSRSERPCVARSRVGFRARTLYSPNAAPPRPLDGANCSTPFARRANFPGGTHRLPRMAVDRQTSHGGKAPERASSRAQAAIGSPKEAERQKTRRLLQLSSQMI